MTISSVLAQAAQRGITIENRNGRLICHPSDKLTPELSAALKEIKPELLLLLPDRGTRPPPTGSRPPLDPAFWDEVDVETASFTPVADRLPCYACRGTSWWRLAGRGTEWVCARCHPPLTSEIEVWDA